MEAGRIVDRGTHAELCERSGYYRDIYLYQSRDQAEAV